MKKFFTLLTVLALSPFQMFSQTTAAEYVGKYNSLVSKVGIAGLGVETLLDKWEADYPDDINMMSARVSYYLVKGQSFEIVCKDQPKYLGNKPVMTLKDSLGKSHNYFQEVNYDDEYFSMANKLMDKVINQHPLDLQLRADKLAMLVSYEKENPDMTQQNLMSLIDYNFSSHPVWKIGDETAPGEAFVDMIQDNCVTLYSISSQSSMSAFKAVSEKMLVYMPKSTVFLSNVGSYYLTSADDPKTAVKYYSKVLKADPSDYGAAKNCVIAAKRMKDKKMEKKYLQVLIPLASDEMERKSLQTQLDALN